jgi:hypothetical protein
VKLHLPYFSEKTKVKVHNEVVEVKAFQIIVWVSVVSDATSAWDPRIPRLPAILDIGNNHNFAITDTHLLKWAGIHAASLVQLKSMRERGKKIPLVDAGLWLHTDAEPFKVRIDEGIAVHEGGWPRLPTLGLRALTKNDLQTFVYGDTKQVIIRTPPPWYWPF